MSGKRACRAKIDPRFIKFAALLLAVIAAAVILAIIIKNLTGEKPSGGSSEGVFPTEVFGVPVHTSLMSADIEARTAIKREIKYIVIHETDNTNEGANAERHSDYLNRGISGETSWHYTVDDTEIYHHIPDDEVAWHAGDTKNPDGGNAHGIGIELCVNSDGNFEKTFENGAKLTAYLLCAYGLDITAVTQHADYMEKNCPSTIRDSGRWGEFLKLVESYTDTPEAKLIRNA